jgi:hypothetical protein
MRCGVSPLGIGEQAFGQVRPPGQCAFEPVDLEDIDPYHAGEPKRSETGLRL